MTDSDPIFDLGQCAQALAHGHDPAEIAVHLQGIIERLRQVRSASAKGLSGDINTSELVSVMLGTYENGPHRWRRDCEIIADYMPPFPGPETRPKCVVRCGESFLRYSKGPVQGYGWDIYGDDMQRPEWAIIALSQAPLPPHLLKR